MRHALSLVLGLVLGPLIYIAAGYSAVKLGEGQALDNVNEGLVGLAAGAVAGALFAVLVMSRLSPPGPVLVGLLYVGVSVWWIVDEAGLLKLLPDSFLGEKGVLEVPAGWGTAMLAVPLLATVFSPRRWRAGGPQPTTFEAAPTYGTPASAAPYYPGSGTTGTTFEPPVYTPQSAAPTYAPTTYEPPTYVSPSSPLSSVSSPAETTVATPTQPIENP